VSGAVARRRQNTGRRSWHRSAVIVPALIRVGALKFTGKLGNIGAWRREAPKRRAVSRWFEGNILLWNGCCRIGGHLGQIRQPRRPLLQPHKRRSSSRAGLTWCRTRRAVVGNSAVLARVLRCVAAAWFRKPARVLLLRAAHSSACFRAIADISHWMTVGGWQCLRQIGSLRRSRAVARA
jgi:hypothetical protein